MTSLNTPLQDRVLLALLKEPAPTIAGLARSLSVARSSASRAIHTLVDVGFVVKRSNQWHLTEAGRERAETLLNKTARRVVTLGDAVTRLLNEQVSLANLAPNISISIPSVGDIFAKAVHDSLQSVTRTALEWAQSSMLEFTQDVFTGVQMSIRENLQAIGEGIIEDAYNTLRAAGELATAALREHAETLQAIFRELEAEHAQLEADAVVLAPYFIEAGFWFSLSTPIELLKAARRLHDEGNFTPQMLKQGMIAAYHKDNCALLEEMIASWSALPHFAPRMPIFRAALKAHIAGDYILSIPALLPHIEGIAVLIVQQATGKKPHTAAIVQKAIDEGANKFLSVLMHEAVVVYVTKMLYIKTSDFAQFLADQDKTSQEALNRHNVLHGLDLQYDSEENSLRAFLLLDALAFPISTNAGG